MAEEKESTRTTQPQRIVPKAAAQVQPEEEEPLERLTAGSFEVGAPYEEPFLSGGSQADSAYREREEAVEKLQVEHGMAVREMGDEPR